MLKYLNNRTFARCNLGAFCVFGGALIGFHGGPIHAQDLLIPPIPTGQSEASESPSDYFSLPKLPAAPKPPAAKLPASERLAQSAKSKSRQLLTGFRPQESFQDGGASIADSFEIQLERLDQFTSAPVVTALAASKEGRFLAAAGDDHSIRVIDVASGKTLRSLAGHVDWIQAMVFSYENDSLTERNEVAPVLYSAGNDGRILKWKYTYPVASDELLRVPFAIRSLTVSSPARLLAIGGHSSELLVMDLNTGLIKLKLNCDCDDQRCVRFSPDGSRLLCGGREGKIQVWDTSTGQLITSFKCHTDRIHTAAFSLDGTQVTSVGEDRLLVRQDLASNSTVWKRELALSKMLSMCLINEDAVAVAGADNRIRIFDAISDEIVATLEGHKGSVAVMSPCGDFLASGSFDTTVRIWDLQSVAQQQAMVSKQPTKFGSPVGRAPLKMDAKLQIR